MNRLTMLVAAFVFAATTFADENDAVEQALQRANASIGRNDDGQIISVGFFNHQADETILPRLASLDHLEELDLSGLKLTSIGLRDFPPIPSLKYLDLSDVKCTDQDMLALAKLSNLEKLILRDTSITDEGVKHLSSLTSLKVLDLSSTNSTDEAVRSLQPLQTLETLILEDTAVTDASLDLLAAMTNLKSAPLSSTRVTRKGIRQLRSKHPELVVESSWDIFATAGDDHHGLLELPDATIRFEKYVAHFGGARSGRGGSIPIATVPSDEEPALSSAGGTFGFAYRFAYKNGIPTITVMETMIEIRGEGTELVIAGERFPLGDEKLRIVVDKNGKPRLEDQ